MLCRLISEGTRQYMQHLLYASVNAPGFRQRWRAARGFCHRHAWMLAESQDALGLAILYHDLIQHQDQQLMSEPAGEGCPVCASESRALDDYLHVIVEHWDDAELRDAIRASDGLCCPHLRVVHHRLRRADVQRVFSDVSSSALAQLGEDLRALIESFDYQHSPPTDEQIKFAWRRALEKVVGHHDIPEGQ